MAHRDYLFLIHFDTDDTEEEADVISFMLAGVERLLEIAGERTVNTTFYPLLIKPPEDVLENVDGEDLLPEHEGDDGYVG